MVQIRPFAALRPRTEVVDQVTSPPYDVMDRGESRAYIATRPNTFFRVTRADALLSNEVDRHGQQCLDRARQELERLLDEGLLVRDSAPRFYLYEQRMGTHIQIGVVAGVAAAEYRDGLIKRHEKTRVAELDGRRRHIETVGANTGLIFLTYRGQGAINDLVQTLRRGRPDADFVAEDGIGHRLWVIADTGLHEQLTDAFAQIPALYVADGHHRAHASFQVWEKRAGADPASSATAAAAHFMAVLFPADQLQILAYNRVIKDLAGLDSVTFLAKVTERFDVVAATAPDAPQRGTFGMYVDGGWWHITPNASVTSQLPPTGDPDALDVAVLQRFLLTPILGIGDPRTDKRIRFVGGIRGTDELSQRVDAGAGVAFTVYPTAIADVMAVADAGEVMPPKSTWFEPKLRSGLVVHTIGEGRPDPTP